MNYLIIFVIFSIHVLNIKSKCIDHSKYQLKGKTYLLAPVEKECMDRNEKCIYVSANDPDNFRGTIGGCMTTVLQFLSTVSFHSTFDNNTFIDAPELFNNYINQCNEKIIVNKNFTSTSGILSLYLSCFSQDTTFEDPNKVSFEPTTRDVDAVNCYYPWKEEEINKNIGFNVEIEEPRYCNEGTCSIFKMSIYNFTSQKFTNFSKFGCLNDFYYGLDDIGLTTFSTLDPLHDFKMYNIDVASEACKSRSPFKYFKKIGNIAYIWYTNCYNPNKEASNNEEFKNKKSKVNYLPNLEDDVFSKRSNKITVESLETKNFDDIKKENILLKQSTILNYFKPIKKSKIMNKNSSQKDVVSVEPNENYEEKKISTLSLVEISQQNSIIQSPLKRKLKSIQTSPSSSNEELLIKKKILEISITEKEKKVLNHIKFEAKIGLYRNFDELPLPELYVQEKDKLTFNDYLKKQLKTFINNKSYNPIDDFETNTDWLLDEHEEETNETFNDFIIPIGQETSENPFADCQYILDFVKDKYSKKK
ncbi:Hypothetical protein SRAE_1000021100 [Strongyloides ratti]|uniref:Uncharacterized protein n=1 Tax=Strongyloides ratti TaxID=34506 RepID=A0A090KWP9_STRRB|nr:Hypothetical protein SRAE_1000021100 [Strongyloides ratti]CEF61935.1 Hypothetical protein SRAE_1000021100 [Strongyloides ratti]